jgi:hypothetical protein
MRVAFFEVRDWERTCLTERLPHDTTPFEAGTLSVQALAIRDIDALSSLGSACAYGGIARFQFEIVPPLRGLIGSGERDPTASAVGYRIDDCVRGIGARKVL